MHFTKLEGLGNDFIVVDAVLVREQAIPEFARRICERHFGVGADGLLLCEMGAESGVFRMRIFNADGGEAELSGNGLRCLAAWLFHERRIAGTEVCIETQAGRKRLQLIRSAARDYWLEVDMGVPILERAKIAFLPAVEPASLVGCELPVGETRYPVTITSMGNPHCSLFTGDFNLLDWETLGCQIERHPYFPNRTNVEFIRVVSRGEIEVRFWERGVGKTLSSGTGSCAATVAAILSGYTGRQVKVRTLGGDMEVIWEDDGTLRLKGPAKLICAGEYFDDASL